MKNKLLARFKHYRNDIIKALFEIVKKCPNESIMLSEYPVELKVEDNGQIFQYRYKMLSIQNNVLIIHYTSEEEMSSPEYENVDDISLFSLDEIFSIINHMQD
ncbi:MAG: hypothetical protein WA055_01765 [Candidatus Moraniibacteriota bacterium]